VLPKSLKEELREQVERARALWQKDRDAGRPGIYIPGALGRKFSKAGETFEWFYLFPALTESKDPETGLMRRHHLHGAVYNRAIQRAARAAGIEKHVTSHALSKVFSLYYICWRMPYFKGNSGCCGSFRGSWRPSRTALAAS